MALTIVIPFLNEGDEVNKTVRSIKETIETNCELILINDASTDGYDYKTIANHNACTYIEHTERKGVAASRNEGVELCNTSYFLLLDAHMRFYEKGWDVKLIELLKTYPRAILCSQTRVLNKLKNGSVVDKTENKYYGGYIDFEQKELFRVRWNYIDVEPFSNITEIPCILGAAYASNKAFWNRIKGLDGLITYGTDEELLSIKTWLEGGRCLLVKDWIVGHIYRNSFPYEVLHEDPLYNRLYTAELLFPYDIKRKLFFRLRLSSQENFVKAYQKLKENYSLIKKQKQYISEIAKTDVSNFLKKNQYIAELNINN